MDNTGQDKTARLEARVPAHIYDLIQRAAQLRGMTLTSYVLSVVGPDARRVVEDMEVLRLSREAQIQFAKALIDPPEPNERLKRAFRRHSELVERR